MIETQYKYLKIVSKYCGRVDVLSYFPHLTAVLLVRPFQLSADQTYTLCLIVTC